ncbi:MAG: glycosyltransferase family 87 protein [Chloroflexia bacterium]
MKRRLRLGGLGIWIMLFTIIVLSSLVAWIQLGRALAEGKLYWDFACYYVGARVLEEQPAGLYQAQTFFEVGQRFGLRPFPYVYPPLFAWLLRPLGHLNYPDAVILWTVLNTGLFAGLLLVAFFLFQRELSGLRWVLPVLLLSPPLVTTLILGQVNVLLLLFLLPAMLSHTGTGRRGEVLRGLGIALAAHLKPVWGLLLLFELFRKRRWSVGTTVLSTVFLWGMNLLLFGPEVTLAFFRFLPETDHMMRLYLTGLDGSGGRRPRCWAQPERPGLRAGRSRPVGSSAHCSRHRRFCPPWSPSWPAWGCYGAPGSPGRGKEDGTAQDCSAWWS